MDNMSALDKELALLKNIQTDIQNLNIDIIKKNLDLMTENAQLKEGLKEAAALLEDSLIVQRGGWYICDKCGGEGYREHAPGFDNYLKGKRNETND